MYQDGKTTMKFKRAIKVTNDEKDIDITTPVYLVFPYSGGAMIDDKTVGMHRDKPLFTKVKIDLTDSLFVVEKNHTEIEEQGLS